MPADPTQYQQMHDLVEALAIGEGIPKPAVYVIDDPSPNAFATGISPDKAAITYTTGLLSIMNREELEGVTGHEMSHIKNHDIRLLLDRRHDDRHGGAARQHPLAQRLLLERGARRR